MAEEIKSNGIKYVGRSLGELHRKEADVLLNAGLKIVSIWESGAEYAGFFREEKGFVEGKQAFGTAEHLGQPEGSSIYFPVHFDVLGMIKNNELGIQKIRIFSLKMNRRAFVFIFASRRSGWKFAY
jgi:hypothetical protein